MSRVLHGRLGTVLAALHLIVARSVIRFMPLAFFRRSLGRAYDGASVVQGLSQPTQDILDAKRIASRVERAAFRLPGQSRCMAKAVALQWMLGQLSMESRLVIAAQRMDRTDANAFHAWVEMGGEMIIGACDRASYKMVAAFEQADCAATDCGHQTS